jgi:hypothetical protein
VRLRTRVLLTILLAVLYFALTQRFGAHQVAKSDLPKDLDKWYATYNAEYFNDKLPKNTIISWNEVDDRYMATTTVLPSGRYHIAFNKKYCLADRVAHITLLHEDCHILTFTEVSEGKKEEHGPRWRTCMLHLALQGAFESELIDGNR